jgi:hypothetical protein
MLAPRVKTLPFGQMNRLPRRALLAGLGAWTTAAAAQDRNGGLVGAPAARYLNFEMAGGIVFDVSVNGGAAAPFLLDTGVPATVLDTAFAAAQGLLPAGGGRVADAGGSAISVGVKQGLALRIGDVALPTQDAAVLKLPNRLADRGRRPRLAGLIGLNGFGSSILRIEWAARRLELLTADAAPDPEGVSLPMSASLIYGVTSASGPQWLGATVTAVLDGTPIDLGLDTAFSGVIRVNQPYVDAQGLLIRYAKHIDFEVPAGLDGHTPVSLAMGRRLELGGVSVDQPLVNMSLAPAADHFLSLRHGMEQRRIVRPDRPGPPGRLGIGALRRWKPFIDIAGQRLVLEPRVIPLPKETPAWRSVGLSLDKPENGFFSVVSVIGGTPAAAARIGEGDRIFAVNGVPASDLALFDYGRLEAAGPVTLRLAGGAERTLAPVRLLP